MTDAHTLATPANMRRFEEAHPARTLDNGARIEGVRAVAVSLVTGEEYSASSGDYWDRPKDEPLVDTDGEPMLLMVATSSYVDAMEA